MSKTSAAKKLYNTSKRQQKLRKTYVFGTKALTFIELSTLKNKTPNLKGLKGQPKICEKKRIPWKVHLKHLRFCPVAMQVL